jgi:hypothetical protein
MWRYLVDEYRVKIGRTTAHRFVHVRHFERGGFRRKTARQLCQVRVPLRRRIRHTAFGTTRQFRPSMRGTALGRRKPHERCGCPAVMRGVNRPWETLRVHPSKLNGRRGRQGSRKGKIGASRANRHSQPPNDAPVTAAFEPTSNWAAPRIEIADVARDWVTGGALKPFKICATGAIRMLEAQSG